MIAKSSLTYIYCGKTGHSVETCYSRKRKVPIVPNAIVKCMKHVVGTKTWLVKSR